MKVPPWSFSSLDLLITCARKYEAERILKTVVDEDTAAKTKGTDDHKAFELRIGQGIPLPGHLAKHEDFMLEIDAIEGQTFVERKVGLTRGLEPCEFFAKDVWWRGVLDVQKIRPNGDVVIIDYKTGRPHTKMRQLHLFSLYSFLSGECQIAESMYYWTQNKTKTRISLPRVQYQGLLMGLLPDLKTYTDAFKHNQFPPTPNYLCQNYCGVSECEFHGRPFNMRR